MPILTNLSVTGRWLQYNGKINNIGRPTKQIRSTDQIFFQSSTSRPFYTSRRRDPSACGIPTLSNCADSECTFAVFILKYTNSIVLCDMHFSRIQ